jgi:Na+-driven multidrug efflux pump
MLFCFGYSLAAFCISRVFGSGLVGIFLRSGETEIHAMAQQFLDINTFFYICASVIYICRNTLHGLGRANAIMLAGVPDMAGRMAVALLLVAPYGFLAVCFGNPTAWTLAALILFFMCSTALRKLRKAPSLKSS